MLIIDMKPIICSYTPEFSLSNDEISKIVDTSDEWIMTRTGIKNRKIASINVNLSTLAIQAAKNTIEKAKIEISKIDLIILATSTPDDLFGSAPKVQHGIGAYNATAFDITAACSGFIIALITAYQFIYTGKYKNILVIGADILSRWVDWNDRSTCILFGDGAGAVIIQSSEHKSIIGFEIYTDGNKSNELTLSSKILQYKKIQSNKITNYHHKYEFINMNGKEIYKFAISKVPEAIKNCLNTNNITIEEIDWLLLHQANTRILEAIADKLCIPRYKIINNIAKYGNTSAASIPLALDEAVNEGKIKTNDIIILAGFGAGLTWGTIILKWI
nr:3-oxoacyl-acyl-carrier-protein synthase 3 [Boldiaceae sp.]